MIEPGQVYRSCDPNDRYPTRVLIKGVIPYGAGQWGSGTANVVTITESGRELRPRNIELRQLHDSPTTKAGKPRRTGYALETKAGEFVAAMQARDPRELEQLRHQAWCRDDACPTCDGTGGDHQIGCQP